MKKLRFITVAPSFNTQIKKSKIQYITVSLNDVSSTQIRLTLVYVYVGWTLSICFLAKEMCWKCLVSACVRYCTFASAIA